jgi:dTDP-glucose pyrophosphorylase
MGLIDAHELEEIAKPLEKNSYGQYLLRIAKQGQFHV